jgi:hypothetical protein
MIFPLTRKKGLAQSQPSIVAVNYLAMWRTMRIRLQV